MEEENVGNTTKLQPPYGVETFIETLASLIFPSLLY